MQMRFIGDPLPWLAGLQCYVLKCQGVNWFQQRNVNPGEDAS